MKYLCLAWYDVEAFKSMPEAEFKALVSQCPQQDAALRASGRLVAQGSLADVDASTSIRPRQGIPAVTDGPFIETKEQVGGFLIVEAESREEAIRIASLHPAARIGEAAGWGIEMRPIEMLEQYA